MKNIYKTALLILVLIMNIVSTQAQAPASNAYDVPEEAIMHYINALNLHDYSTAYNMLVPEQSYESYVAGYAETERIVPYFGHTGAAAGSIYVTTVLLGYQTDGTVETYYGYFRLANGGNFAPPVDGYILSGSSFQLLNDGTAPQNGTIQSLLSTEWNPDTTLPPEILSISQMSTDEADTILDYYDLINAGEFGTAYNQWLNPTQHALPRDYRLPYNQFVTGYNDTVAVTVYAGDVQPIPAQQERAYLNSYVPIVLVAEHTDGTFVSYSGCYALGTLTVGEQGIVNGRFQWLSNTSPNASIIFTALNNLNCANLGMGI